MMKGTYRGIKSCLESNKIHPLLYVVSPLIFPISNFNATDYNRSCQDQRGWAKLVARNKRYIQKWRGIKVIEKNLMF